MTTEFETTEWRAPNFAAYNGNPAADGEAAARRDAYDAERAAAAARPDLILRRSIGEDDPSGAGIAAGWIAYPADESGASAGPESPSVADRAIVADGGVFLAVSGDVVDDVNDAVDATDGSYRVVGFEIEDATSGADRTGIITVPAFRLRWFPDRS